MSHKQEQGEEEARLLEEGGRCGTGRAYRELNINVVSESLMVNKNKFEDRLLCQSGTSLSGGRQVGREVLLRT